MRLSLSFHPRAELSRSGPMANCSTPSSSPENGRTLTPWLRRLKRRSSRFVSRRNHVAEKTFNVQRSTPDAQRPIQKFERWALDVGRWAFTLPRRVKGAWWPSRSSKPLLIRFLPGQGRFDSYPLRLLIFDFRFSIFDCMRPIDAVAAALCCRRPTGTPQQSAAATGAIGDSL